MKDIIMLVLAAYAFLGAFYFGFLAYASVVNHGSLPTAGKVLSWWLFVGFALMDVIFNVTFGTLIFMEPPVITKELKSWTLSVRMSRLVAGPDGWRKNLASTVVTHLLLPFTKNY